MTIFSLRSLPWLFFLPVFTCIGETGKTYTIVNNIYHGRITLDFNEQFVCLREPLLREWGFLPVFDNKASFDTRGCLQHSELARWNIKYFFDNDAQLVTLVIPNELMSNKQNGVTTSRWDDGIPAAFANYHINYQRNSGMNYQYQNRKDNLLVTLNSGANLGAWRLRSENQYQQDSDGVNGWLSRNMTLSRPIRSLRAQLTLGNSNSPSNLFDSFSYRGVLLASEDRMLPDGLRPFSPWIRGIAKSNAEVVLRQNGSVIYQTFVAPGAFTLRDVYPPGSEGDIEMTLTESDGTETVRNMPYAAMPNLTHPDVLNYQLLAGHYKPWRGSDLEQPAFYQGTLTYGLTRTVSVFGGNMSSPMYQSWGGGVGFSLGAWGALSQDYRYAVANEPRRPQRDRGGVYRLRYAKAFLQTGTSLSLQAQYYPRGQHYRSFEDTIYQQKTYWWDWDDEGHYDGDIEAERLTQLGTYLNQNIGDSSNLYLTLQQENYRQAGRHNVSLTLGFDHTWNDIDYDVSLSYERYSEQPANGEITFSVSIPLELFSSSRPKLNYSRTVAHHGERSQQISVSGTALKDYSLSYSMGAEHHQTDSDSLNASLGYQYNAGEARIGIARGGNFRQRNVDVTGSVMIHPYGVTLGQTLGDTMALVEVDDTPGVGIDNQFGVTTDLRGFALVSYLTPYRVNRLTLDTYSLPGGISLPESEYEVVPTSGAVVFGRFSAAVPTKDN